MRRHLHTAQQLCEARARIWKTIGRNAWLILLVFICVVQFIENRHAAGELDGLRKALDIKERANRSEMEKLAERYEAKLAERRVFNVTATAYTASARECGKSDGVGAMGVQMKPGFVAVSRDMEKHGIVPGRKVRLETHDGNNLGIFTVADYMAKKRKKGVDVFTGSGAEAKRLARQFGKREVRLIALDTENPAFMERTKGAV